jgi:MerR family redox-sensitive transcriptional activator SoxR
MPQLTISEVARRVGLRPSAIRYYELAGILPAPARVSGQRRYGVAAVYRLAVLRRAQEAGLTLEEIRQLFTGLAKASPFSAMWRRAAAKKQVELEAQLVRIQSMKDLLSKIENGCHCETVEECGERMLHGGFMGGRGVL